MTFVSSVALASAVLVQRGLRAALHTDDLCGHRCVGEVRSTKRGDRSILLTDGKNLAEGECGCAYGDVAQIDVNDIIFAHHDLSSTVFDN